jgi:hypothetical protein
MEEHPPKFKKVIVVQNTSEKPNGNVGRYPNCKGRRDIPRI